MEDILLACNTLSEKDKQLVKKACLYAKEKHGDQKRYSGAPYYTHPYAVGRLLAELSMPKEVIIAGILHDTIEDTDVTIDEIQDIFGTTVAFFVDAVTNLGDVRYHGLEIRVKSLQKLFVATSKDIRVIIIRLMDRLDNMRTLQYVPVEKHTRIALETKKIYAPIADRLGMGKVKAELEDIAFKFLEPKIYAKLQKELESTVHLDVHEKFKVALTEELQKKNIGEHTISSRLKSIYSIYKKKEDRNCTLQDLHDISAFRIIVRDIPTAYLVFGILHGKWQPLPKKVKDYIAVPKPNGYRALHTSITVYEQIIEIQILTEEMYQNAQFGLASHFSYKDKRHDIKGIDLLWFEKLLMHATNGKKLNWFEQMAQISEKKLDENMFVENIENDFLKERMFIFTPMHEVVDLPLGSTVTDFAFAIHSDVGIYAKGAFVNGKYVSLHRKLHNGDVVKIEMGKKPTVTEKWLDWVKTVHARSLIRQFIRKNS